MPLSYWLASLQPCQGRKQTRGRRQQGSQRKKSRQRLTLENLEDRVVPSTVTWINPTGGDWDTVTNWQDSSGVNRLPGSADDALINFPGITVTHFSGQIEEVHSLTSQANINFADGELDLEGSSSVSGRFDNAGTVKVISGQLTMSGGGNETGAFVGALGTTLGFDTNFTFAFSVSIVADQLVFSGVTATLPGSVQVIGKLIVVSSKVSFTGSVSLREANLDVEESSLDLTGSTMVDPTMTPTPGNGLTVHDLTFTTNDPTDSLLIPGDLHVTESLLFDTSGILGGTGTYYVDPEATANFDLNDLFLNQPLVNRGQMTLGGRAHIGSDATLTNDVGGTLTFTSGSIDGAGTVVNSGTFVAHADPSDQNQPEVDVPFTNEATGLVHVAAGDELTLGGGTLTGTAGVTTVQTDAGGVIRFAGSWLFAPTASIAASGLDFVNMTTTATVPGPVQVSGKLIVVSSTVAFTGSVSLEGANVDVEESSLDLTGSTMVDPTRTPTPGNGLTVHDLTFTTDDPTDALLIPGDLHVTDSLLFNTSGILGGSGTYYVDAGATANFSLNDLFLEQPLVNLGQTTVGGLVHLGAGATLTNAAGGTLTFTGGLVDGDGSLANQGLLIAAGPPGDPVEDVHVSVYNAGTFEVTAGTFEFDAITNPYVQTAGSTILDGGNLEGPMDIEGGGLIGTGIIFGSVLNAGQLSPGFSPGTITISGDYTQTESGSYTVEIGGATAASQYDQLVVSGNALLGGELSLAVVSNFVPQPGETFTIFHDTNGAAVNGAFEGLPDGTIINSIFRINYVGADVVLTAVSPPSASLSGTVFADFNNDGQVDFGETGIPGVAIALTGTDDLGHAVSQSQTTDSAGAYVFLNLRPGSYHITETQPAGYVQGIDTVGTAGGSLVATDQFFIQLVQGIDGMNYNFGEQPPATGSVKKGQSAGIGFWNNKNGQALILALNGGAGHQLGDWLAATMPNTFGVNAGSNNLTGKTNAVIAALFQKDFVMHGVKLDAQVLATALSVYATNATLDSTAAAVHFGFTVSSTGLGTDTVNVASNGDAFGAANNTSMSVLDLLQAADDQATSGVLYNDNNTKRNEANSVFSALNEAGGI
jgi:SdrD B-like domain